MYRQHYPDDPGMHNQPEGPPTDHHFTPYHRPQPSFNDKVKSSFVTFVIGLAILIASSCLQFWNEGRAVQTAKSLAEGLHVVHRIPSGGLILDENNGKLVHVVGALRTAQPIYDELYGVSVHAVKLRRSVEMYQWVEEEHKRDVHSDETSREEVSYSYLLEHECLFADKEWRPTLIRSTSFYNRVGHHNPESIPVESREFLARDVQVGNLYLSQTLAGKITGFKPLTLKSDPTNPDAHLAENTYYHGYSFEDPQVGDVRVSYEYAGVSGVPKPGSVIGLPDTVSIIAGQSVDKLVPYQTAAGDIMEFLYMGHHTAAHIIQREQSHNILLTWAIRFLGWLLMFIGFGCLTSIIVTLANRVPLIRDLVTIGVTSLNACLALCLSLTVTAVGWIVYHPVFGLFLFLLAISPFVASKIRNVILSKRKVKTTRNLYD